MQTETMTHNIDAGATSDKSLRQAEESASHVMNRLVFGLNTFHAHSNDCVR